MALSANTIWEVRSAGSDTNGGGFVAGASGTDYSQQNSANSGGTDSSVTDGVTAGTTTVTSATANFGTSIVGNIIYIAGGTAGITGGWYQVTARASTTSITVDRATGLTAGTGVTINIGGALATLGQLSTNLNVPGMIAYVKAATYSISTGLSFVSSASSTLATRLIGYTTTRGDIGRATVLATAGITMVTCNASSNGLRIENFVFDGASIASTAGLNLNSSQYLAVSNCIVKNTAGAAITCGTNTYLQDIEVTGCTGGTAAVVNGSVSLRLYIHDNTVTGITSSGTLIDSIIANNTGATSDGISGGSGTIGIINNCVVRGNGRHGISMIGSVPVRNGAVCNCILEGNGGYGISVSGGSATMEMPLFRNNAYYNNTSGARTGFVAEVGAVTLSALPYAGSGDYSLNATSGAGAACRAAGIPGLIVGSSTTGYRDIGAAQHQDSGGGPSGGIRFHPGMTGGMNG